MKNGQDWSEETYIEAERAIGYTFRDKELLKTCFTHSTYRNNVAHGGEDNERLEFLGDAVLQFIVSDGLYRSTRAEEGKLTDLRKGYVSKEALTPVAEKLRLMDFLRHSNQESDLGGKDGKLRSSLFEAVVAGIYLDGGISAARDFLDRNLSYTSSANPITELQEYTQERVKETPVYRLRQTENGFFAEAEALGLRAEGEGRSKQAAKEEAAASLLQKLKERKKH